MIGSFEALTQKAGKRTLILNNRQYVTIDLPQLVWFYNSTSHLLMFVGFKNEVDLNKIPDDAQIHHFDLPNRQYTRINDCGLFGVCISQADYHSLKDINSIVDYFFESSFEGVNKEQFIRRWKNPIDLIVYHAADFRYVHPHRPVATFGELKRILRRKNMEFLKIFPNSVQI